MKYAEVCLVLLGSDKQERARVQAEALQHRIYQSLSSADKKYAKKLHL